MSASVTPSAVNDTAKNRARVLAGGVKVQPLSWHCQTEHAPGLVLGYAATTPGDITTAVAAIGRALAR
ncbi:hypothetical protein AB0A63_22730 [Lentzea sp. NPDC042327]|uniref:hypothetical protein n=1 Tax=Lentzea sp. NPDC042327 TaxID=3154801 RepID=UPI0033DB61A3